MSGRRLLASLIALLPFNPLRVALYRHLLGYRIGRGTRIAAFTLIDCQRVALGEHCRVGPLNFISVGAFEMGNNAKILSFNFFGRGLAEGERYQGTFSLGDRGAIHWLHFFDVRYDIRVGSDGIIAGKSACFWTHSGGRLRRGPITIGDRCYIGSHALFAPGTLVADDCTVAMGSMVAARFEQPHCLIAGNPATVRRTDYHWLPTGPSTQVSAAPRPD